MFLADAVAGYVETLDERGFDSPFIALLHHFGFNDVHLTHGQYEFGKDFIARRVENSVEYQYCIQSKAGDLRTKDWREVCEQIESMRYGSVVHPSFNADLPRRLIVVITGRLKGGAGVEFQNYNEHQLRKEETPVELWDFDTLVPQLAEILIAGVPVRERARTIELWGKLSSGEGTWAELRQYSRHWFAAGLTDRARWEHTITGAMLAHQASLAGREDLASCLAFLLIRREWENPPIAGADPDGAPLTVARRLFTAQAEAVWKEACRTKPVDWCIPGSINVAVTYPVRVARLFEILSLLGLSKLANDPDGAEEIAGFLQSWIEVDSAGAHLVGDDWATSLLVTCTFLHATGRRSTVKGYLRSAAAWLLDRIEDGNGIAGVGSSADEVVDRILGVPYDHIRLDCNRTSYAVVVIADLAWLCGNKELYADICNDIWALDIIPQLVLPTAANAASLIARVEYPRDGSRLPTHHNENGQRIPAFVEGALFDCIAGWATHRDRHIPAVISTLWAEVRHAI
jgi:hypothetical protein